jgi:chromate transport protein ChrA
LAQKAITDKMTRILVFIGATAGLMYNALWYFPLLMVLAGCTSITYDYRVLHPAVKWLSGFWIKKRESSVRDEGIEIPTTTAHSANNESHDDINPSQVAETSSNTTALDIKQNNGTSARVTEPSEQSPEPRIIPTARTLNISWQFGTVILLIFPLAFIAVMVLRGTLPHPTLLFSFFSNIFLAGTIIFGGGPVVIPLLREYVVSEGWVSPRDFLIGFAIIQAFPGPNFNFAVYLGGLAAFFGGYNPITGAVLGYIGIFLPGIVMVHGIMGIWSAVRGTRWVKSGLRGVNAAAVGLIYTAVYKVWQAGFLGEGFQAGTSLGDDPWWLVVGATSYVGGMWFRPCLDTFFEATY